MEANPPQTVRALHTDASLCFTNEPLSWRQHSIKISSHINRHKCATDGVRTRQVHFKPARELSASLSLEMKTLTLPGKEGLDPRTGNCLSRTVMTASAHMWLRPLHHHGNHRERLGSCGLPWQISAHPKQVEPAGQW